MVTFEFDLNKIQSGITTKVAPSYAGRRSGGGSKIAKTNRIRVKVNGSMTTIYCAYPIIQEVRELLIQMQQVYAPKKGANNLLFEALKLLAVKKQDHFPASSLELIRSYRF